MSMFTAAIAKINNLLYGNVSATNWGDAAGLIKSSANGTWQIAFHTASPGVGGNLSTNECTYTGYARLSAPRDNSVIDGSVNPVALLSDLVLGTCTVGTETITHMSIGFTISGTDYPVEIFTVTPNINVSPGVTPRILAGNISTTT